MVSILAIATMKQVGSCNKGEQVGEWDGCMHSLMPLHISSTKAESLLSSSIVKMVSLDKSGHDHRAAEVFRLIITT